MNHLTRLSLFNQLLVMGEEAYQRISLRTLLLVVVVVSLMKLKRGYFALQCRGLELYLLTAIVAIAAYSL